MIKLVAFDWNGTLFADTKLCLDGANVVMRKLKIDKTISLKELQDNFTIPISQYWHNLGFDKIFIKNNTERITSIFYEHYESKENLCRTRSGARKILALLSENDIGSIIFSNHIIGNIEKQLTRLRLKGLVADILARPDHTHTHFHMRSKDDLLKTYIQKLKLAPKEILVVGDTDEEIEIAKKLGYYSTALTDGEQSVAKLKAAGPSFIVHDLKQLITIIQRLNAKYS